MQNLRNPKWMLIINTLPIILVLLLFWSKFTIIRSLLDDIQLLHWKIFGSTLFSLGILNLTYSVILILKKRQVSVFYAWIALLTYIPYIYVYSQNTSSIIPFSIPRWMVSGNIILYVGTFLMPTLVYSLFIIVLHFTPKSKKQNALINFLAAIAVPLFWYIFGQIILPLWQPVDYRFGEHVLIVFLIIGTLLFLFFVIRGVYILAIKKGALWKKYELIWKIPITILFPLLGLAINNGVLYNKFTINDSGVFGDFNNPWFYILAVINGVLICLPHIPTKKYQFFLCIGRSITFSYTLYFFLVFLPFLPLSVVAIVLIGAGFLMLTPLLLFVIHIQELVKNITFLKTQIPLHLLRGILVISFLVIPICITILYRLDRHTLEETLDYVYTPDYAKEYEINTISLKKTIHTIKGHKKRRNSDFLAIRHTPYLSSFYNWIVLDNLTLSNAKISDIEHIFFGVPSTASSLRENIRNDQVNISNVSSESIYDSSQNTWKSWIHLDIKNDSPERFKEYATTITLPNGCWVSDYYLYVGDRKEMGLLAEKKAAKWVFSQIRNENKDPGILYYLTGNKIAFRVFPFSENETRKTGIEFIHKEPITLTIDGHAVTLGKKGPESINTIHNELVSYISSKTKQNLKQVKRKPYFHFLVDASTDKEEHITEFTNRIKKLTKKHSTLAAQAKISFVNTYSTTYDVSDNWEKEFAQQSFEGGFYLDRAIKKTLFDSYQNQNDSYPVMVVVTDSLDQAVLNKDFSDFQITFPDHKRFYNLSDTGTLEAHALLKNPRQKIQDTIPITFDQHVLAYTHQDLSVTHIPDNANPSIILRNGPYTMTEGSISEKNWLHGLSLQGMWLSQTLFPEQGKKDWLQMVRLSFTTKIMTPVTSYLVVENEAQKAILKKKQEQILASNKSLDIGEDTPRMSEPHFILLLLLLVVFIWYRKQQRKNKQSIG